MEIKQITPDVFDNFADECEYHNFHQSLNYALLKVEEGYEYDFIGLFDNDTIKAAALVLEKKINGKPYGYIPDSFLIDYEDKELLRIFTEELAVYFKKQGFVFIKINPRIVINTLDKKGNKKATKMHFLKDYLEEIGYSKLKDNLYFESRLPRFSAIVDLEEYGYYSISKNTRNKVNKAIRKGINVTYGNYNKIKYLNELLDKSYFGKYHFADYYSIFDKNNMVDYYIAELDYIEFLKNAQDFYEKELVINKFLTKKVIEVPSNRNINRKMNSDKALEAYRQDINIGNFKVNDPNDNVAAAMVIKYKDTVTLLINDFDRTYKDFAANYLLIYYIIRKYKNEYKYFDLNGIVGDFEENPYSGLNRFKFGFNPKIVEYVGEYDLVLNRIEYNRWIKKGLLAEEFNRE